MIIINDLMLVRIKLRIKSRRGSQQQKDEEEERRRRLTRVA